MLEMAVRAFGKRSPAVELSVGDDCALLREQKGSLVWTIDACEEGAHFERDWMSPMDLAHKAFHASVSDLAAMGAIPVAALSQLTLGPDTSEAFVRALFRAQARVSAATGCPIVGGNVSRGPRLSVVTTALGRTKCDTRGRSLSLRRSGARPGDELWLVGSVGWARLGLELLRRPRDGVPGERRALLAFRRPRAQVIPGQELVGLATACMDVSDGLLRDAPRLARASGVKLVLEEAGLRSSFVPLYLRLTAQLEREPIACALEGGEDYALLATGPSGCRPPFARLVGRVEAGHGAYFEGGGRRVPLRGGFQH